MYTISQLSEKFSAYLESYNFDKDPVSLYEPIKYILSIGGKRIRPALVLAGANLFSDNIEDAQPAALAVEVFHNFSLVHDDLMDNADIRRGEPSVHKKYDDNTAILSGDAMLILCYRFFEKYNELYIPLTKTFTQTALEVCEGQRWDMDFEVSKDVSIDDYIRMITYKTSVLIAASLQMGAMISGAGKQDAFHAYEFGKNMGIAFQIQDDILDTFGSQEKVGKKIGGDILQKKKTYLYLKSLELLSESEGKDLQNLYASEITDSDNHISRVRQLFETAHVKVHAEELKLVYQQLAMSHLDAIEVDNERKKELREFADHLLNRTY